MYLRLFGRDGATTRAAAAAERRRGHYTLRIAIPAGGARELEIGIHGTSDLPVMHRRRRPVHVRGDHGPDGAAGAAAGPRRRRGPRAAAPVAPRAAPRTRARRAGDAGDDRGGSRSSSSRRSRPGSSVAAARTGAAQPRPG